MIWPFPEGFSDHNITCLLSLHVQVAWHFDAKSSLEHFFFAALYARSWTVKCQRKCILKWILISRSVLQSCLCLCFPHCRHNHAFSRHQNISKNIISIAVGLNHSREAKDLFVDIAEKVSRRCDRELHREMFSIIRWCSFRHDAKEWVFAAKNNSIVSLL